MTDELETRGWIDPHVHILPPRRMRGLVRWVKKFTPDHPVSEEITAEEILEGLRSAGITVFFNLVFPLWEEETKDLNRFNFELCSSIPGALPFGSLHIENEFKEEETRRCIEEYGFVGMKLHPFAQRFPAFDPAMDPLFAVLNQHGRPLLVHTGFDLFYGMNLEKDNLIRVLESYPHMPILMVHSLFPHFKLARELLERYPQVWMDMTNSISCMRIYEEWGSLGIPLPPQAASLEVEEVKANREYFDLLFEAYPHRILYGTDYPVGFGNHRQLLDDLLFFGFPEETVRKILMDNVISFLASCGIKDLKLDD
jgi:hypothetical protein